MNDLVIMKNKQAVTSSLQVAEVFEKNHRDVLKAITNLKKDVRNFAQMFSETNIPDSYGRNRRAFYMNRDGFTLLAMGFTGDKALKFKLQYIEAFNSMEEQVKLPTSPREIARLALQANEETNQRLDSVEGDVKDLKENQVIPNPEYSALNRRVNQRVSEVAHSYGHITQKQRGELFKDIGSGIKKIANVSARSMLRKKDYQMVMDFINDWEPSTATKTIIRQTSLRFDKEPA
ncbi:Rha family transcriptional regulator [Lactiplantibacillus plantarum]|jgi:Rha family phage regulatory protein|nr:Rha family transcriptional regulator [Lactiplantibacillus plantarum]KLD41176.1 antirepressor [Lactiplantibacillus plantarum]KLD58708.1 antirepressor [Lactiplantibacillus plantarum]MCC6111918.1 Rha family transcriptional regulator [Lactiplantibacillus plantarum]MCG3569017.1 Rha family transcriptional regulator [Lactiplantibacillus plantarum]MCG3571887.1 Rha family transcriptional regulator [Lactiplantibacillus plantarum]